MIGRVKKRIKAAWLAFLHPEIGEIRDPLTGALKREIFPRAANRELARAQRGNQSLCIVFMDVDNLKKKNDEEGHKAGDSYLKAFVQNIVNYIRPYDILARWGGDEFILLFPNTELLEAQKVIFRVYESFPNFSWGICERFGEEKESLELLIAEADSRMYRNKERRRKTRNEFRKTGNAFNRKVEKGKISNPVGKPRL